MMMRRRLLGRKWLEFYVVIVALVLFAVRMKQGVVRSKATYVAISMRGLRRCLVEEGVAAGHVLPDAIPDSLLAASSEHVLADPFDTEVREGAERLNCKVECGHLTGELDDFSFKGNKLKYLRLNDRHAVVYSYGPDRDDDIGLAGEDLLEQWVRQHDSGTARYRTEELIRPYRYDSARGRKSNGDIVMAVNLDLVEK